jgi:hypothetical protein
MDRALPSIQLVIPAEDLELLTQRSRELRDEAVRMAFRLYAERQKIRHQIARMRLAEQLYQLQRSDWRDRADRRDTEDDDWGGRR